MRLSPVFSACAAFCLAIAAATYPWVAQLFIMAIGFAALIDALLDLGWGIVKKSRRRRERLAKEVATAKIKDLEYKKLKGEYVAVADVEADAREAAAMLRSFAISAPTRYSALLENRTQREAEEVLEDIFRDLLKTINGSRFAKE